MSFVDSRVLNTARISSKFALLLLVWAGVSGGGAKSRVLRFCNWGIGGGILFFIFVDFNRPLCFINDNSLPIFMNSCWPNCGWGFFFLTVGFSRFSFGVVGGLQNVVLGIFLGDGFD